MLVSWYMEVKEAVNDCISIYMCVCVYVDLRCISKNKIEIDVPQSDGGPCEKE